MGAIRPSGLLTGRHLARIAWIAGAVCLGVFAWNAWHTWFSTSDTLNLLHGVGAADRCLHHHVVRDCNQAGFGDVSHFALLQYLPAFVFKRAGATLEDALRWLCALNSLAFLGLLALMWHAGRRSAGTRGAALLLVAGIGSPLLWYSISGFAAPLAALSMALFVTALVLRWPPVVAAAGLLFAALAKEPNIVVLLALGALVVAARPREERWDRGELVAIGVAAFAAVALSVGFNEFRYGTLRNPYYLDTGVSLPLADRASSFGALLVAPNVGLLWFWPAAIVVAGVAAIAAGRTERRVVLLILGLFALLVAGYANFWGAFGWESWGPRHVLPWVPAFLIALTGVAGRRLSEVRAPRAAAIAGIAVIMLAAVPHVAVFREPTRAFAFFEPSAACPMKLPDIHLHDRVPGGAGTFFDCARRQAWEADPTLLDMAGHADSVALLWWLAVAAALLALGARAAIARPEAERSAIIHA